MTPRSSSRLVGAIVVVVFAQALSSASAAVTVTADGSSHVLSRKPHPGFIIKKNPRQVHRALQGRNSNNINNNNNNNVEEKEGWYPNWGGGTTICLFHAADTPAPPYIVQQNLLKPTMGECCGDYFWYSIEYCQEESPALENDNDADADDGGAAGNENEGEGILINDADAQYKEEYQGSKEWYAYYNGFRCVQDCAVNSNDDDPSSDLRCGGILENNSRVSQSSAESTTTTTTSTTTTTTTTTATTTTSNSTVIAAANATTSSTNATAADSTNATASSSSNSSNTVSLTFTPLEVTHTYPTAGACCQEKFSYLALGLCETSSTSDEEYEGSGEYYVDWGGGRCVQDCAGTPPNTTSTSTTSTPTGICGGIITQSSTRLYTNASTCCATQLSYIDPLLCTTRSNAGGNLEGTFRLYPHSDSGTCIIDHNPADAIICSIGYTCQLLRPSAWVSKLYPVTPAGVEQCCSEGLPFVNPTFCKAKTMGIVSRKWFVDYTEKRCFQDCKPGSGSNNCAINNDPSVTYYDTPEECCDSKLGYQNQNKCIADSTGVPYTGTNKFYADYKNSKCSQDCPVVASNGNDTIGNNNNTTVKGNCGGVVEDASVFLHKDAPSCCAASLSYMSLDLCVDRSDSSAEGTGKYYPTGGGFCVKDTSATCPEGETCLRVDGWLFKLYDTVEDCCGSNDAAMPSNVNPAYCQATSTSVGTGQWFQHENRDRCAKHCTDATDAAPACDVPIDPSTTYYANATECCTAELHHLNVDTCSEMSEKGGIMEDLEGTDEYYVDWIHQKCVRNCPVTSGTNCGGIARGTWVTLRPDVDTCCDDLHYIAKDACIEATNGDARAR